MQNRKRSQDAPIRSKGLFFKHLKDIIRLTNLTKENFMRGLNVILLVTILLLSGCASAGYHRQSVRDDTGDRLTVGKVQKEIKIGMSSADVIQALGSPNVVTTDEERREVWVYDKIASEIVYSDSNAGLKFLTSGSSGAVSRNQRTLTVVIKFDNEAKVRDFAYHTSSF